MTRYLLAFCLLTFGLRAQAETPAVGPDMHAYHHFESTI
jgi:hypothetical protein